MLVRAVRLGTIALLLLGLVSFRMSSADKTDFRRATWGMSRTEVILSEDELPFWDSFDSNGDGVLRFGRWTDGHPLVEHLISLGMGPVALEVSYYFFDGRLVLGELHPIPVTPWSGDFTYGGFYDAVTSWLTRQYGPGQNLDIWRNGPQDGELDALVYIGELTRVTGWTLERSSLLLIQAIDERTQRIQTVISFVDKNFATQWLAGTQ